MENLVIIYYFQNQFSGVSSRGFRIPLILGLGFTNDVNHFRLNNYVVDQCKTPDSYAQTNFGSCKSQDLIIMLYCFIYFHLKFVIINTLIGNY